MPRRTQGGFLLTKQELAVHEKARSAFAEGQKLLPGWRAMARMLARNPKLNVTLHAHMTSFTDGQSISIRVPSELADLPDHDRSLCGHRDGRNVLECPACDVLEDVNITIIHELSHIVFDTFEEVSPYEQAQLLQNAIMTGAQGQSESSRAAKIKRKLDALPMEERRNYLALGDVISHFMPTLINACEDIRVNSLMQAERPGTRIMFDAQTQKVFDEGVKQLDGSVMRWIDQPLNAQAIIGVYCKVGGFRYEHALRPEVVTALDDPELVDLCNQMRAAKSVRQVYRQSIPLLECLRRLGFLLDEDDEEDDQPDPGEGMESEDDEAEQPEGDTPSEDGSEGSSGAEPQSKDADSEEGEASGAGDSDDTDDSEGSDADDSGEGSGDPSDEAEGEGDGDGSSGDESDTGEASTESSSDEDGSSDSTESQGYEDASGDDASDGTGSEGDSNEEGDDVGEGKAGNGDKSPDPVDPDEDGSDGPGEAVESPATPSEPDRPGEGPDPVDSDATDPSESPQEGGKDTRDSGFDASNEEMGTPEDIERILTQFGRHEEVKASPSEALEEQAFEEALEMAIEQMNFFDSPSLNVTGVTEHKLEDATGAWAHSPYNSGELMEISEGVMSTALQRLRIMFTDNARGRTERNRRSGKVDGRVLAKRAPAGDDRLFKKRIIPGHKDYFVLIGLDVSGSTSAGVPGPPGQYTCRLDMMKAAAGAKAELLARLGIPFAMYAHSGSMTSVDIFEIKGPKEKWGTKQHEALAKLRPYSANLDGHSMEYYRKVIEKRTETDRLLLYYTDGAMPAANYAEELEILQREIKICERLGVHLVGIGVNSDAPKKHGLDTILLDTLDDIPEVVKQLRNRLMKGTVNV